MTGDLNLMMQLRNRQIMSEIQKDANVKVAEDIGKMAELGYFDVEFTMYGCAYWNPENDKMYYKVSSLAEDIYTFTETAMLQHMYASNIVAETKTMPVPSGMKELIAQDVKMSLARELQKIYPKDFFVNLYQLAARCANNQAADVLWQEAEHLAGRFDEEQLRRFEEMVNYTYSCRSIKEDTYQQLIDWLKEERSNMADDFVSKDIFEKTLYAVAYEQDGAIQYIENAQKDYIYEKAYTLEQQGIFVTPVFSKTFWYNYEYRLADVKKDFRVLVREVMNAEYIEKIKTLRGTVNSDLADQLSNMICEVSAKWGDNCANTLTRYAHRWGIL